MIANVNVLILEGTSSSASQRPSAKQQAASSDEGWTHPFACKILQRLFCQLTNCRVWGFQLLLLAALIMAAVTDAKRTSSSWYFTRVHTCTCWESMSKAMALAFWLVLWSLLIRTASNSGWY